MTGNSSTVNLRIASVPRSSYATTSASRMDLDNNAHSVFLLHYHLVLVVKYRRQVFDDAISGRAKEIFAYIAPNYNITLEELVKMFKEKKEKEKYSNEKQIEE